MLAVANSIGSGRKEPSLGGGKEPRDIQRAVQEPGYDVR